MSAGNPIIPIRLTPELLAEVHSAIAAANQVRRAEPYTLSSWLRAAIQQKLDHNRRGKHRTERSE